MEEQIQEIYRQIQQLQEKQRELRVKISEERMKELKELQEKGVCWSFGSLHGSYIDFGNPESKIDYPIPSNFKKGGEIRPEYQEKKRSEMTAGEIRGAKQVASQTE